MLISAVQSREYFVLLTVLHTHTHNSTHTHTHAHAHAYNTEAEIYQTCHSLLLELPPGHFVTTIQLEEVKQSIISLCHSINYVTAGPTLSLKQIADSKLCF